MAFTTFPLFIPDVPREGVRNDIPITPEQVRAFFADPLKAYSNMQLLIRPDGFWGDTITLRVERVNNKVPLRIELDISTSAGGRERGIDDLTAYTNMAQALQAVCTVARDLDAAINSTR